MAKNADWGRMTADETEEAVIEGWNNLTEDQQIKLIVEWVKTLGGPDAIVWEVEKDG